MTTAAKWVLALFLIVAAGFAALGAGHRDRAARIHESAASHPQDIANYLSILRGERPWAAAPAALSGRLLGAASSQLGRGYVYGGASPAGFDCSGFTSWAYARAGASLPRTSSQQFQAGTPVAASALRPGDLVFFGSGGAGAGGERVGHVGIYLSQGRFIHSSRHSGQVAVDDLSGAYWSKNYVGARRVLASGEQRP
ncbi:MAG: C40 family peptidase [Acidobacteriota bacterium]